MVQQSRGVAVLELRRCMNRAAAAAAASVHANILAAHALLRFGTTQPGGGLQLQLLNGHYKATGFLWVAGSRGTAATTVHSRPA